MDDKQNAEIRAIRARTVRTVNLSDRREVELYVGQVTVDVGSLLRMLAEAEAENARLREALLASLNVMRKIPHGQSLSGGETVEVDTAFKLAKEALEPKP